MSFGIMDFIGDEVILDIREVIWFFFFPAT